MRRSRKVRKKCEEAYWRQTRQWTTEPSMFYNNLNDKKLLCRGYWIVRPYWKYFCYCYWRLLYKENMKYEKWELGHTKARFEGEIGRKKWKLRRTFLDFWRLGNEIWENLGKFIKIVCSVRFSNFQIIILKQLMSKFPKFVCRTLLLKF